MKIKQKGANSRKRSKSQSRAKLKKIVLSLWKSKHRLKKRVTTSRKT